MISYSLTQDEVDRLSRILRSYENGRYNTQTALPADRPRPPIETWVAKTTSTITALAGSVPGTGTAALYELSGSSLVAQGDTVAVYNLSTSSVASGSWETIVRDPISGMFFMTPSGGGSALTITTDSGCHLQYTCGALTRTAPMCISGHYGPVVPSNTPTYDLVFDTGVNVLVQGQMSLHGGAPAF